MPRGYPITDFWLVVEKTDGCWLWRACTIPDGYGMFRDKLAHRTSWEMENGPIPPGMHVCHHCDNPPCVRPDHLFLGTASDNMQDRNAKGRHYSTKGEGNGHAKLAASDVPRVKQMAKAGQSYREIAGSLGVSRSSIAHIVKGRTWKEVA